MADGNNGGPDGKALEQYLNRIDVADNELVALKAEHMRSCKRPRGQIREVLGEAKAAGYNMTAFRAMVGKHRAERKIEQQIAELEADDLADYQALQLALGEFGETPLGQHALDKAKPKDSGLDTLAAG